MDFVDFYSLAGWFIGDFIGCYFALRVYIRW